jgi:hypothetical protein
MTKLSLLLCICSALAMAADSIPFMATQTFGIKTTPRSAAGGPNPVLVIPGDVVIPQFVTGGGWTTQIVLVNLTSANTPIILDFWRPDGTVWPVRFVGRTAAADRIEATSPARNVCARDDGRRRP